MPLMKVASALEGLIAHSTTNFDGQLQLNKIDYKVLRKTEACSQCSVLIKIKQNCNK